jgi:hypothetical protein
VPHNRLPARSGFDALEAVHEANALHAELMLHSSRVRRRTDTLVEEQTIRMFFALGRKPG